MNKRHKKKVEGLELSNKNGIMNDSSNVLSAKRKNLNFSGSSKRFIGSARRFSISKLTVSLKDFDLNEEFNCWEHYKNIEKGEANIDESILLDSSNLESYTKLFNSFYSSILLGTGNYIHDITQVWNNFITSSGYCTENSKNELDILLRMFFGKLFINISLGDVKGYYSAMIYLLVSSLPCKPQITTVLRPYIIRKIMRMINESVMKNNNNINKNNKKPKKKSKKNDSESDIDSNDLEQSDKENVFSGFEKIEQGENIIDLQLKLINCLVLFCRNIDISNNTSKAGLEGFNEFIEGLTELLIYNNEYQLTSSKEIDNFRITISKLIDYSSNFNLKLISSFIENKNFSISRMISICILILFINIGENRYIKHASDYKDVKSKRFRVIKLESVNIEIVLYSIIVLFKKLIPLSIIGNEVYASGSLNTSVSGNKSQNALNQLIFKLIRDIVVLFPEIIYPNILLIIGRISEIQYSLELENSVNGSENYHESDKEDGSVVLSDSEKSYENENKKQEKLLYGIEVLKELANSIRSNKYYYIDDILSSKLYDNNVISKNEIFLNDPFIGFIFSLYLLASDKSEARQSIIDQIHSLLIPSIIESSEDKYSAKILLFDTLKQSLFDEDDNSIENIKEINSFISFLSSYMIDYKLNTLDDENMHTINVNYFPFKYPHLIYRRIMSILPFMFHSSKPNYRIIAIDITGHILQLNSSLLLLSNFTQNIKDELNFNLVINKNDTIIEREKKIFNKLFILIEKTFNSITNSVEYTDNKDDINIRNNKNANSSRTSSARQSIEWSGITMESRIDDSNINFAQCEMVLQLYNVILFLLERTKDISPNVRIKSVSILSLVITAIYELLNESSEGKKSFIDGLGIMIDDFVQSNRPIVPIMDIIIEFVFDEKAICRKGSLLLWDSFFNYIKLKNANILSKKNHILQIFKSTLTDSSIIVRRHSLQSLYTLYYYSPQYKWISNMWINYGLPTIIDTENIIVEKTTEICHSMLLEQIKKLSEYMTNYDNKDSIHQYIINMKSEYVFSWTSLKSNKENQIQIISLYRMSIRNIIKKYPLLLQPLLEFLNTFIHFFFQLLNCSTDSSLSEKKIEFPDLPFIIMEEMYVYINQNNKIDIQNDNMYILTENIYKILEMCIVNEYDDKKLMNSSISLNNLLLITNSLLEIYKLIISLYNIHINTDNNKNKLLLLYGKIICNNDSFYSRLTKILINYDESDKNENIFLKTMVSSSSLSTILYLIYLWDEINEKKNNKRNINSQLLNGNRFVGSSEIKCILPEISDGSKNIELIYIGCIYKLSNQINAIRQNKTTSSVFLNIRILGELFLLNYTLTNMNINSPNKEKKEVIKIMEIIDSSNVELIIPYIEELYKYYGNIYLNYQNNSDYNNEMGIKDIESIMSALILVLGQGCYSSNNIANNIIKHYLIPEVLDNNTPLSIRNNIIILLHDLYILHTTLVDPHLSSLFNMVIKGRMENDTQDNSLILRKQTIILLSDLIGQGYIKLRGSYFLKLLNSLVDRNSNIRNIAHGIFERILLKTNMSILVQNFVEIMCYLNNWLDHPCIKALNMNDKMSVKKNSESIINEFKEEEKIYIFRFIFNHLSDKQKNEIITRIVHDFLALFVDQSNVLKLPESHDTNEGKTLRDALYLLYSPELCIYHKYSKRSFNKIPTKIDSNNVYSEESESIIQENNNVIESSDLNGKSCTNILLKELIQASLAIDIIPTLLSLKHLMKQSCSPFIKDIHKCIGELLKDYKNNLSSIIQDNTLIKELEYDFKMGLI
ncbi:hypothetical protein FG386_000656 [Cryptosporidium ryanae]|uniref:uncharacterized protein n=1 Tax=Cryptosporidium ryanae TaxID=515981 RepID=UPI00351AAB73|nr:hypothetical protein FG386_000656 [Cryptosporidium ryanae]